MSSVYSNPNPDERDPAVSSLRAALVGRGAWGAALWFALLAGAIITLTLVANRCGDDNDGDLTASDAGENEEAAPDPTATPVPTAAPTATAEPTPTPEPTAAPTPSPEPTATPEPTPAAQPTMVTATIEDGIITLAGVVADDSQRGELVAAAASVVGLEDVVDDMSVDGTRTRDDGALTLTGRVEETTGALIAEAFAATAASGAVDDSGLELVASTDVVAELNELFAAEPIQFASGSASILAESEPILDQVAATLAAAPGLALDIVGHTDSTGDPAFNTQLSLDRATAVLDYLVAQGVDPALLSADGRGDTEPIADNDTEAGRQQNRRIEFEISEGQ